MRVAGLAAVGPTVVSVDGGGGWTLRAACGGSLSLSLPPSEARPPPTCPDPPFSSLAAMCRERYCGSVCLGCAYAHRRVARAVAPDGAEGIAAHISILVAPALAALAP